MSAGAGPLPGEAGPLPDRLVAAALERFGLSLGRGASATFVRHGENTTYRVTADDGRQFALRIDRPGYQTDRGGPIRARMDGRPAGLGCSDSSAGSRS